MKKKLLDINVVKLYRCNWCCCWWWYEMLQADRVQRWSDPGVITRPWDNWPLSADSDRKWPRSAASHHHHHRLYLVCSDSSTL